MVEAKEHHALTAPLLLQPRVQLPEQLPGRLWHPDSYPTPGYGAGAKLSAGWYGSGRAPVNGSANGSGSGLGPATPTSGSDPAHRGVATAARGTDCGPLEPAVPPTIPGRGVGGRPAPPARPRGGAHGASPPRRTTPGWP